MLSPEWEEDVLGEAEVLKVFKLTGARSASVGGCRVKQGRLVRNATFRILRGDEVDTRNVMLVYSSRSVYRSWL